MRYAIVSDVHANIQAWKAVLRDMRKEGVDAVLCLGDVIGYGPNPAEVLDSCYEHVDYFILGNHDAVIGNRLSSALFNDNAKFLIEWTRDQLNDSAAEFFSDMPLRMDGDGFICAHAELALPGRFAYIYEAQDAIESFTSNSSPLMFVGHTHFPARFRYDLESNLVYEDPCVNGYLKGHERYLINVGSVGDPRDGSTTASYCIYDADKNFLTYRQVPFDIKSFKKSLQKVRLPIKPFFLSVYEGAAKEGRTIKDMALMEGHETSELPEHVQRIDRGQDVKTARQKVTFSLDDVRSSRKSRTNKAEKIKSDEESRKKGLKIFLAVAVFLLLGCGAFLFWKNVQEDTGTPVPVPIISEVSDKAQPVIVQKTGGDLVLYPDAMKKPEIAEVKEGRLINWKSSKDKLSWKVRIKEKGWYRLIADHQKKEGEEQLEVKMGPLALAALLKKSTGEQELALFENASVGDMDFSISLKGESQNDVTDLKSVKLQFLGSEKPFVFEEAAKSIGGFESGTYKGWLVSGPAFGYKAMTEEDLPDGIQIKGIRGSCFAASLAVKGSTKGSIQTPPFTVRHKMLAILAAGGKDCEINLYVGGQLAEKHSFSQFSDLKKIFFDLKLYAGQQAYLEFLDKGSEFLVFDDVELLSSDASSFKPGAEKTVKGTKKEAQVNELNKFLSKAGAKLIRKNFKGCLSDLEEAALITGTNLDNYKNAVESIADFEKFFIKTFEKDLKKETSIIPKGTGLEKKVFVEAIKGNRVEVIVDGSTSPVSLGMIHLSEEGILKRVSENPLGLYAYHINKEEIEEKIKSIGYNSKNPLAVLVNAAVGGLKVQYEKGAVVGSRIEIWAFSIEGKASWELSLSDSEGTAVLEKPEIVDITQIYPAYKSKGMSRKSFPVYSYDLTTEKHIKELSFVKTEGELNSMLLLVRNSQGQIVWQKSFNENETEKSNLLKKKSIPLYSVDSQPPFENLAYGKPSTAGDPHSGAYIGINDGIWSYGPPFLFGSSKKDVFPKFVTVDLESVKKLNALRFGIPNRGSTRNISLQYSLDNNEFKTIMDFEFQLGNTERYMMFFETIEARYLRVRFNKNYEKTLNRAVNTHVFMTELEAYLLD